MLRPAAVSQNYNNMNNIDWQQDLRNRIEMLLVAQDGNKRIKHQMSSLLIVKGLVWVLTDMHNMYVHDKLKLGVSYTLVSNLHRRKYKELDLGNDNLKMHYDMVQCFIDQLLDRHWNAMVDHFNEHNPGENYCKLMDATVFKGMLDKQTVESHIGDTNLTEGIIECKKMPVYIPFDAGKTYEGRTFGCTLTKAQKKALVDFINQCNINFRKITLQDIEDFLNCKEGFYIRPRVNTHAAFILGRLHKEGFINNNWASLTGERGLLHSSQDADRSLTAHNITQLYSRVWKKGIEYFSPEERRMYNFILGLNDIK